MKTNKNEYEGDENELDIDNLSDEELQEAFAAGIIKPGLNIPVEKEVIINKVTGLKEKLAQFKSNLKWIEKLDLVVKPAVLAPELEHEVQEEEKKKVVMLKNHRKYTLPASGSKSDRVLDDFKREMIFYTQGQAGVLEGIKKLKEMGVPTKRPDDYFAQMAKSDEHMHKVRENLAAKQAGAVRSERAKELRRLKKLSKQTQIERKLTQQKESKKMLDEVKKFRKGHRKDLNFLDKSKDKKLNKNSRERGLAKKKYKDQKFGFGGKKRGNKINTRSSVNEMSTNFKSKLKSGFKSKSNIKRPGRNKRIKKKSMKK